MTDLGVYLDYNATTPVKPAVREAMGHALEQVGNPSSVHRFGALARRRVEDARAKVAALVNAEAREVVFTSGGTESNDLAIAGSSGREVLASAVEHDSVLAAGKTSVDFRSIGADLLTLSAHKLGGPMGVGALIVRDGLEIAAQLSGGAQEMRRRAGTENLPGIVGFGVAAELAAQDLAPNDSVTVLRDRLERSVREIPGVRIFSAGAPRLGNTSCFTLPGVSSETQVMALDLDGVAISAGAACSSGKVGPSHVLAAMGVPEDEARCAVRVSLGWQSEAAHVERFLESWFALYRRTGARDAARALAQPAA